MTKYKLRETASNYFHFEEYSTNKAFFDENGKQIKDSSEYDCFLKRIFENMQTWDTQVAEIYGEKILSQIDNSALRRHALTWTNGDGILGHLLSKDRISLWSIMRTWWHNTYGSPMKYRLAAVTAGSMTVFGRTLFTEEPSSPLSIGAPKYKKLLQITQRLCFGAPITIVDNLRHQGTIGVWDKDNGRFNLTAWNRICEYNNKKNNSSDKESINNATLSDLLKESHCPMLKFNKITELEWMFMFNKLKAKNNEANLSYLVNDEVKLSDLFKALSEGGATTNNEYGGLPHSKTKFKL